MGAHDYPPFSLRISDVLMNKIKTLAALHCRSTKKEIEYILKQFVEQYEKEHGAIPFP